MTRAAVMTWAKGSSSSGGLVGRGRISGAPLDTSFGRVYKFRDGNVARCRSFQITARRCGRRVFRSRGEVRVSRDDCFGGKAVVPTDTLGALAMDDSAGRWPGDASFATAKRASRASEPGRVLVVRSGHVALNRRGTCFQWNGTLWATWSGRSGRHPRPARRGVARRRARALGLETLPALGVPDSFDQLLRWLQGGR